MRVRHVLIETVAVFIHSAPQSKFTFCCTYRLTSYTLPYITGFLYNVTFAIYTNVHERHFLQGTRTALPCFLNDNKDDKSIPVSFCYDPVTL